MKKIYLARDLAQAQLLVNLLEMQMIPSMLQNFHQSGGLGDLAVSYPEVWIRRDQDEARARRVIEQFEGSKPASGAERACPHCQELNPEGFEVCWHCEKALD